MGRVGFWVLLLALGGLAFGVREVGHLRAVPLIEDGAEAERGWFSSDPDGLYHMRRVERSLEEGLPVAVRDPYLAFPQEAQAGAPIPWPPYYTLMLHALIRPFAPGGPGASGEQGGASGGVEGSAPTDRRRAFVERAVATWPAVFASLTSVLVALAAAFLAGAGVGTSGNRLSAWTPSPDTPTAGPMGPADVRLGPGAPRVAAAVAGITHALGFASLRYSYVGNGDHHAWVSLLFVALLLCGSHSLARVRLSDVPRSTLAGTVCGILAGLNLGSWVAALELLVLFDAALLVLWFTSEREAFRGLCAFGATFHAAATLVVLPAALGSPWALATPASIVNLTAVHPLLLAAGFAFFACTPLRSAVRRAPLLAALFPLALAWILLRSPLAASFGEAFTWARGTGDFMAFTNESRPLIGGEEGAWPLLRVLGYGLPLALVAWGLALRGTLVPRGPVEWAPWLVAFPVLLTQAAWNRRFAELALPLEAVLLGYGAARLVTRIGTRSRGALAISVCVLAALAHPRTLVGTAARLGDRDRPETPALERERGMRALSNWLARATPEPGAPPTYGVLAQWDLGHELVWAGRRPVVATNFGSYLGADSYLNPWRFFLERSEVAGGHLLAAHRARYVVVTSRFRRNLEAMVRVLHGEEREAWIEGEGGRAPLWLAGLGARMGSQMGMHLPAPGTGEESPATEGLGTLRMVYLSPDVHRDRERVGPLGPVPVGAVFEHVAGARLRASGEPGEVLRATLRLAYPGVARERIWRASAAVGPDGVATLRVPYATGTGVDGVMVGALRWSIGERRGEGQVSEEAVVGGLEWVLGDG